MHWTQLRAHFNPWAETTMSRIQNTFIPTNINSMILITLRISLRFDVQFSSLTTLQFLVNKLRELVRNRDKNHMT